MSVTDPKMKLIVKPCNGITKQDFMVPKVMTGGALGADVFIQKTQSIQANRKTGLAVKIPLYMAAIMTNNEETECFPYLIVERSSTCLKKPFTQANSIGVIDRDYRDELGWLVRSTLEVYIPQAWEWNIVNKTEIISVEKGERLCQIIPYGTSEPIDTIEVVDEFPLKFKFVADRVGGMGSTGL